MTLTVNVKVQRAACRASEEGTSLAKGTQISGAPVLTALSESSSSSSVTYSSSSSPPPRAPSRPARSHLRPPPFLAPRCFALPARRHATPLHAPLPPGRIPAQIHPPPTPRLSSRICSTPAYVQHLFSLLATYLCVNALSRGDISLSRTPRLLGASALWPTRASFFPTALAASVGLHLGELVSPALVRRSTTTPLSTCACGCERRPSTAHLAALHHRGRDIMRRTHDTD